MMRLLIWLLEILPMLFKLLISLKEWLIQDPPYWQRIIVLIVVITGITGSFFGIDQLL